MINIDFMIAEGTGLTRLQAMAYFEKLIQTIEFFLEQGHRISTPLFRICNQSIANLLVDWLWESGITARNTTWEMTENVQTQKNKLSSPPIPLYAIVVLISLLFVAAWIVRKKIINFFFTSVGKKVGLFRQKGRAT